MWKAAAISVCAAFLLASCGRPDASGIYVSASDRQVTLVQLVETKDGTLTGRAEELSIDSSGNVKDRIVPLDGAASDGNLVFKPTSVWFGGLQATGTLTRAGLALTTGGNTFVIARSTMENYQAAVAHFREVAASTRQKVADAKAAQAAHEAQLKAIRAVADKIVALDNATTRLRSDTERMNKGLANSPDFGARSAANTARIERMLKAAPTLSSLQRGQLGVQASQIEVDTNQVEVARSQYAIELNQVVQDAGPVADQVEAFCNSPQGAQFAKPCGPAKAAAADFRASLERGRTSFNGYKQAVQNEISRQDALIRQIDRMQ
jgi:hypothetical protein